MAPGALTGLSDDDLELWRREMAKACALTGEAALAAVDVVIWSLREWEQGRSTAGNPVEDAPPAPPEAAVGVWTITEELGRLRETCARLRRQVDAGTLDVWEPATLRRQARAVGQTANGEAREMMAGDIAAGQEEAEALAQEIDRRRGRSSA